MCLGDRICAVEYRSAVVEYLRLCVEGTAYGVVQLIERVDVVVDFVKSLATGVVADGPDEADAVKALKELVESKFGEE